MTSPRVLTYLRDHSVAIVGHGPGGSADVQDADLAPRAGSGVSYDANHAWLLAVRHTQTGREMCPSSLDGDLAAWLGVDGGAS